MKNKILSYMAAVFLSSGLLIASGCSVGDSKYLAGDLNGVNHTADAINYYSVNGFGGPNISPHGFGGGACCILLPREWEPGLNAFVKWETDPNPKARLPATYTPEYEDAYLEHKKKYLQHGKVVEIPQYDAKTVCSLKIHFLPCHQLKATTACAGYGRPAYPIKEPLVMKEPAKCPK
jgi:hypothetical protein